VGELSGVAEDAFTPEPEKSPEKHAWGSLAKGEVKLCLSPLSFLGASFRTLLFRKSRAEGEAELRLRLGSFTAEVRCLPAARGLDAVKLQWNGGGHSYVPLYIT
jgi:hypothetical protein